MKIENAKYFETGMLNTPLHKLPRVSEELGIELYIKRDDLTGYGLGGNKLRKLDYLVQDAVSKGCTTLLTYGGPQTNHGRLTAAAAARFGLKCVMILNGPAPKEATGNLILDRMMGAEVVFMDDSSFAGTPDYAEKAAALKEKATAAVVARYEAMGDKVYLIPVGGSTEIGAAGYIRCAGEMGGQLKDMGISPDYIFCAYGSAGTYAGMTVGLRYYSVPGELVGVCVSNKTEADILSGLDYINRTAAYWETGLSFSRADLHIEHGYVGPGYNIPDPDTRAASYFMASREAILLDFCYTGKVFRGLMDMAKTGRIPKGSRVVMLHTGGAPGIFSGTHQAACQAELWGDPEVFTL